MDKKYFKGLTRKEYIQKAQEILEKSGEKDISIRKIADELMFFRSALPLFFQ